MIRVGARGGTAPGSRWSRGEDMAQWDRLATAPPGLGHKPRPPPSEPPVRLTHWPHRPPTRIVRGGRGSEVRVRFGFFPKEARGAQSAIPRPPDRTVPTTKCELGAIASALCPCRLGGVSMEPLVTARGLGVLLRDRPCLKRLYG